MFAVHKNGGFYGQSLQMTAIHEKGGFCGWDVKMLGLRHKWAHSVVQPWCKKEKDKCKCLKIKYLHFVVPGAGIEPARIAPLVFETSASTDSAIWANTTLLICGCKGTNNF